MFIIWMNDYFSLSIDKLKRAAADQGTKFKLRSNCCRVNAESIHVKSVVHLKVLISILLLGDLDLGANARDFDYGDTGLGDMY